MTFKELTLLIRNSSILPEKEKIKWLKISKKLPEAGCVQLVNILQKADAAATEIKTKYAARENEINQKYWKLLDEFEKREIRKAYRETEIAESEKENPDLLLNQL